MPPEVMTRPEVVSIIVAVVVALGGALIAFATAAKRWADSKFSPIAKDVKETKEQAVNNHGPEGKDVNLRDQVDDIQEAQERILAAIEVLTVESRDLPKKMDRSLSEIRRDIAQEREERQSLDQRSRAEHASIWDALRKHHT